MGTEAREIVIAASAHFTQRDTPRVFCCERSTGLP